MDETSLRRYGVIRGLVFGAWGETSPDVELLLETLVDADLIRNKRMLNYYALDDAKAALARWFRMRWGLAAVRANARLTLERLPFIDPGISDASKRRDAAYSAWQTDQRRRALDFWRERRLPR